MRLLFMTVVFCLFQPLHAFADQAQGGDVGVVAVVVGKVEILSAQSHLATAARVGQKVYAGDSVMTEAGSRGTVHSPVKS